ncbi:GlxA family transcriptional regulator [Serinibacter salmoneus]|uniref:AraC family transcriptional regulator with amidase-like domain n=1 Tax=Serinibacter salmoneus TaxID=556530 RepID=A0A2A9CXD9_9MICO|nr:helix-turn-helix domain-containing protein [Serinibacter salmoneus]PFG19098.1 AraC family transcriptional regulator with amidase-like domain [Serinibacter salmoneus]
MTVVGVLIGPGRRAFDIAAVREVYGDRTDRGLPCAEVRLLAAASVTDLDGVQSLRRTHPLDAVAGLDLLIVPGSDDPLLEPATIEVETVAGAADASVPIASLCTGAFTLATAGLLEGREATTHWRFAAQLARRFPKVKVRERDLYCGGDGVWTSAGVTAGIDLLLHLVRLDWGAEAAEIVARSMVTPVFRPGSQAQYADTVMPRTTAPSVERLQLLVSADLRRPWPVVDLAGACAMSPRTFHRWFADRVGTTPLTWLNDLRVREAQRLLEQTGLSVLEVANAVGYASDDLLRKHFGQRLGISPTGHRAAFRRTTPR